MRTPWPATGVSRALRARVFRGMSPRVSPKTGGVRGSVRRGVSGALRALGSGVFPRVSPECPGHLFDTPGTLSGHFLDTPEPGARRAGPGDTGPRRTLPRTPPVFGDTLGDTPRDTSGPKGPRDSCSRPGRSQTERCKMPPIRTPTAVYQVGMNGDTFHKGTTLRLLNALNSEDRGLKVRFPLRR